MQNQTMFQFFHWFYPLESSLWPHAAAEAEHLSELGISAVWLPSACKGNGGRESMGYDIYDLFDLGEFDQKGTVNTRFGSKEEYIEAIRRFHDYGIQVYADIVVNHKAGGDDLEEITVHKVNPENRNEVISDPYQIKAYTKFFFPGRKDQYSAFKWDFHCFSGVDWDAQREEQGVFKILNEYGADWEKLLGDEKGNFDYLMFADTEFRNPAVREELIRWGLWYVQQTGVDGFRLDAVKHISPSFLREWLTILREKTNKELFAVGEYASTIDLLIKFQEVTQGCMALFDFPLHHRLRIAATRRKRYDLRSLLDKTLTEADPIHSVTFVDNHDTQAYREESSEVKRWFRSHAYALILLREKGYPCVFYPDLYGYVHLNEQDGRSRKIHIKPCPHLETLLFARKRYAYGIQRDFFTRPDVIGWTREGEDSIDESGCAVLFCNGDETSLNMTMGPRHAKRAFRELTGSYPQHITLDDEGKADFPVRAKSIAVWARAS